MIALVTWVTGCAVYAFLLSNLTPLINAILLSSISLGLAIPFFGIVHHNLPRNRLASFAAINPRIEFPVRAQIFRAWCLACMAGYFLIPFVFSNLEWLPGLFLILSLAVGAAGRFQTVFTGRNFLLTDFLFDLLDGIGLLIGSIILGISGRASPAILVVGAMAIIFPAGSWLVSKTKKVAASSGAGNPSLRLISGFMTGYLGVALLPTFSSEVNNIAGMILVFVMAFVYASQYLQGKGLQKVKGRWKKFTHSIPFQLLLLIMRIATGFLVMLSPYFPSDFSNFQIFLLCFAAILGLFPRLCCLGIIGYTGLALTNSGNNVFFGVAFCLSTILVILGGGGIALWSPENNWLRAYAGTIDEK